MIARAAAVLALTAGIAIGVAGSEPEPAAAQRPNVLVVMTDDQAYGSQSKMPALSSDGGFIEFTEAFANTPVCCPARATFLSGQYSHRSGVEHNRQAELFNPADTLATALRGVGYDTGLFGKYLNRWPWDGDASTPPGWDRWVAFKGDIGYYDYTLSADGEGLPFSRRTVTPNGYSTGVLADAVDDFIRDSDEPFFAYYAPYGPHGPFTAPPRHEGAHAGQPVPQPPNFNRRANDQEAFFAELPQVDAGEQAGIARKQWDALLSVDEALARFQATLAEQGELDDTVIVFVGDNGYSLGSHRWQTKACLYEECAHVPLLIKAPGAVPGATDALVSNVDVPATILDYAGATLPSVDGASLAPLLTGERETLGRPVLLHARQGESTSPDRTSPPTSWGIRTESWKYIRYNKSGEEELFNLDTDPYELNDLAADPAYAATREALEIEMEGMR